MKIAFSGAAGCGKDTAAAYIQYVVLAGEPVKSLKFAGALYKFLNTIEAAMHLPLSKPEGPKDRGALQGLGTWIREYFGAASFINIIVKEVEAANLSNNHIIITDLRYKNEAEALIKLGFKLVRIERPSLSDGERTNKNLSFIEAAHDSENELLNFDKWDQKIINDGTLDEFYSKINDIFG